MWFKDQESRCELVEGVDFDKRVGPNFGTNPKGGNTATDFVLTLRAAKRIGMVAKGPRGNELRDYFLDCEAKWLAVVEGAGASRTVSEASAVPTLRTGARPSRRLVRGRMTLPPSSVCLVFARWPPSRRPSPSTTCRTACTPSWRLRASPTLGPCRANGIGPPRRPWSARSSRPNCLGIPAAVRRATVAGCSPVPPWTPGGAPTRGRSCLPACPADAPPFLPSFLPSFLP